MKVTEGCHCYWCGAEITKINVLEAHESATYMGAMTHDEYGKYVPYKPDLDRDIVQTVCPNCWEFTIIAPEFTEKEKKYMEEHKEWVKRYHLCKKKRWYCLDCGKWIDWKDVFWIQEHPKSRKYRMCKKCKKKDAIYVQFKPRIVQGMKQTKMFQDW